ncbi:MAG: hypothetical protein UMU75_06520, partial [Halomonas sp.]|nr:hypothetical protein [Halomonas sp.]
RLAWLNQEARLRLRAGQADQGSQLLADWLEQGDGQASDFWLMAQVLAGQQRWKAASDWVDKAREATASPTLEQLSLAASIYQHAGRDNTALATLDDLLDGSGGSADTWRRAAALAQRLGDPGRAAALWEAAWRRGILDSDRDLLRLARLHMAGGTPARAAEHLAAALERGRLQETPETRRLLAQAWTQARDHDKALAAWRELAGLSDKSQDWQQLGELAYGWGRWQTALEALGQARKAGGETARNWLLSGIVQLELGDRSGARRAFEAARQAGAQQAQAWLASLEASQAGGKSARRAGETHSSGGSGQRSNSTHTGA